MISCIKHQLWAETSHRFTLFSLMFLKNAPNPLLFQTIHQCHQFLSKVLSPCIFERSHKHTNTIKLLKMRVKINDFDVNNRTFKFTTTVIPVQIRAFWGVRISILDPHIPKNTRVKISNVCTTKRYTWAMTEAPPMDRLANWWLCLNSTRQSTQKLCQLTNRVIACESCMRGHRHSSLTSAIYRFQQWQS